LLNNSNRLTIFCGEVSPKEINLRSNNFVKLPESILKLKSLKRLNLIGISLSPTDKNKSIIKELKAKDLELIPKNPKYIDYSKFNSS